MKDLYFVRLEYVYSQKNIFLLIMRILLQLPFILPIVLLGDGWKFVRTTYRNTEKNRRAFPDLYSAEYRGLLRRQLD